MSDMVKVREDLARMVERGKVALMSAYVTADPDDVRTYAADLMADLAHYVDSVCGEGSGAHALSMGSYHYECELVGEGVLTVEDSRIMPDLDMVCPDCGADVGEVCHPDCSTFWTEEE